MAKTPCAIKCLNRAIEKLKSLLNETCHCKHHALVIFLENLSLILSYPVVHSTNGTTKSSHVQDHIPSKLLLLLRSISSLAYTFNQTLLVADPSLQDTNDLRQGEG